MAEYTKAEQYAEELVAWKRKQVNVRMDVLSHSIVGKKGEYQIYELHRSDYDAKTLELQFELGKENGLSLGSRDYSAIYHITGVYDALAESYGANKTSDWVHGSDPRNLEQTYSFPIKITKGDQMRFGLRKAVHGLLGL